MYNVPTHYSHNKSGVGDVIVVRAVGVHQLHSEGELGQGDVVVDVVVRIIQPLHRDLKSMLKIAMVSL